MASGRASGHVYRSKMMTVSPRNGRPSREDEGEHGHHPGRRAERRRPRPEIDRPQQATPSDDQRRAEQRQPAERGDQGEVVEQVPPRRREEHRAIARQLVDPERAIRVEDVAHEHPGPADAADPRHQLFEVDDARDGQPGKPAEAGGEPVPGSPPVRDPRPCRDQERRREREADDLDGVEDPAGGVRGRRVETDAALPRQGRGEEVDGRAHDGDDDEADEVRKPPSVAIRGGGRGEDRERRGEGVFADAEGIAADRERRRQPAPAVARQVSGRAPRPRSPGTTSPWRRPGPRSCRRSYRA